MTSVSVLGAGAWGTALALSLCRTRSTVTLWTREADHAEMMRTQKENSLYLPGIPLPETLAVTSHIHEAIHANILLLACPAQVLRSFLEELVTLVSPDSYLVICSKGIELNTGKLLPQVVEEIFPHHCISVLSGPTFAQDVALGLPAAAVLATQEITTARWLASSLSSGSLRLSASDDITGVSVGGSLKNVIAIGSGIIAARCLGDSARAAFIDRGLSEICRLGMKMGAYSETFLGLAGIGDLMLSCLSSQSRNMSFGLSIGAQEYFSLSEHGSKLLKEGIFTSKAVMDLVTPLDLDVPLLESMYKILHRGSPIEHEIQWIFSRPFRID